MSEARAAGRWQGERVLVLSPTPTHPQDFGNRKRIFRVCSHLKNEGAEITFVHYPAEAEWRHANPWAAEHTMTHAWAQYFTIAPARELHQNARGDHHEIDEWWDDAIGQFLRWLFKVQQFDVFIVNYAWMSRAFEYAPDTVLRILDTHDRKSGRKELLASHGIAPEYFFTTEDQEAIALKRADLVWAIKDEEREHFARIAKTPVLTLPHLDPASPPARPKPDPDGYLRVGFLAARNSINQVNIENFLRTAEPVFREALAPIKIAIAGSICDRLGHVDSPFVERKGRVASAEDFYATVDCVAVPMMFSTGLKIKTGEALSAGLPVVSTAHAFEGYEPADKFHTLADFTAMADALVELAFAGRARLDELAAASARTYAATAAKIADTYAATRALVRERERSIVLAVDSRAFVHGGIFNLVLRSSLDYLCRLGSVTILVVKGSADDLLAHPAEVDAFGRVVAAGNLASATEHAAALAAIHVVTVDVQAYLAQKGVKVLIADALHPAFFKSDAGLAVFSRTEMIALSEGRADFALPGEGARRTFVVTPRYSRSVARSQAEAGAEIALAPCFSKNEDLPHAMSPAGAAQVILLGSMKSEAMALALALAKSWRMEATVVLPIGETSTHKADGVISTAASDFLDALVRGDVAAPIFALDLSAGRSGLQLAREILERLRVPVVGAGSVGAHPMLAASTVPFSVATEFELFELFRAFATNPAVAHNPVWRSTEQAVATDRGWTFLRTFCDRLFANANAEFA